MLRYQLKVEGFFVLCDLTILGNHLDQLVLSAPVDVLSVMEHLCSFLYAGTQLGELLFKGHSNVLNQTEHVTDLPSLHCMLPFGRFVSLL